MTMADRPLIVHIRRHSCDDGPGIRSVAFFKGCPLRCVFCQNPETRDPGPEIAFSPEDCIGCGACADACPNGAIDLADPARIDRKICRRCGDCADVCPGNGLRRIGVYFGPEKLCAQLLRDRAFYRHSGGGVTLSGGECTFFPDYLHRLLEQLKAHRVHVAIQTCGHFDYEDFAARILPRVDLIYYDVKIADPEAHRRYTGVGNERILDNLARLLHQRRVRVRPRIPLVPGITATRENLSAVVDFLCRAGADSVSLLPYNPLGMPMFARLGKDVPSLPQRFMNEAEETAVLADFTAILREKNAAAAQFAERS